MEDVRLKGTITKMEVLKDTPVYFFKSGHLLVLLVTDVMVAFLAVFLFSTLSRYYPELSVIRWHHILFMILIIFLIQIIKDTSIFLMKNSQAKAFGSQIEVSLSETEISVATFWDGGEKNITANWSGIKKISDTGPLIVVHLKSGRVMTIYLGLADSETQKEEVLTVIRQKAEEHGIAVKGF